MRLFLPARNQLYPVEFPKLNFMLFDSTKLQNKNESQTDCRKEDYGEKAPQRNFF